MFIVSDSHFLQINATKFKVSLTSYVVEGGRENAFKGAGSIMLASILRK